VYHAQSSSSPPPAAPLAPVAQPRSRCREARVLFTGRTKKTGEEE